MSGKKLSTNELLARIHALARNAGPDTRPGLNPWSLLEQVDMLVREAMADAGAEPETMLRHADSPDGGCYPWCTACLAGVATEAAQEIVPGPVEVKILAQLRDEQVTDERVHAYNKQQLEQALRAIDIRLAGIVEVLKDGVVHVRRARSDLPPDQEGSMRWLSRAGETIMRLELALAKAPYIKSTTVVRLENELIERVSRMLYHMAGPEPQGECGSCDTSVGHICECCRARGDAALLIKLVNSQTGLNPG